ncbi:Eukaryotic translation initiation factor 5 [Fusarium oxysporum f. sp. albedinis]|nr:Eukaryotic translation initiation factor 5 [Fusarium oxysporum f. sp. albedinis]
MKFREPENPEPPEETPIKTKKWSMEIHGLYSTDLKAADCTRKDDRRSRTVWGFELNRCYDFRSMPGTDCREYIGTKEQGGCSGNLPPHSILVPDEGYNCIFFFGDDCTRPFDRTSDHSCMSTNTGDGWVSNQIGSFRCLEETKK